MTERDEQLVAVLEVAVDRAGRHAGARRHLVERRPLVTFFANQCARGFEQRRSRPFPLVALRLSTRRGFLACHTHKYSTVIL